MRVLQEILGALTNPFSAAARSTHVFSYNTESSEWIFPLLRSAFSSRLQAAARVCADTEHPSGVSQTAAVNWHFPRARSYSADRQTDRAVPLHAGRRHFCRRVARLTPTWSCGWRKLWSSTCCSDTANSARRWESGWGSRGFRSCTPDTSACPRHSWGEEGYFHQCLNRHLWSYNIHQDREEFNDMQTFRVCSPTSLILHPSFLGCLGARLNTSHLLQSGVQNFRVDNK